ncbi:acetylxylan esterase [uncultured Mucilaginibacter sp.]|uniref:acetylxylan esterase n=1 Tax=uncultured Mucilaginibacter sp. TaxID=797541 RepID=UPI0025DB8097|nr:acetylxylan esterase [uncultured Mucilaginibacter sp.]
MKLSLKFFVSVTLIVLCYSGVRAQYIFPENFNAAKQDTLTQGQNADDEGNVFITVTPAVKNAIFTGEGAVGYTVKLKNAYKKPQEGKVRCFVTTEEGVKIYEDSINVKIDKKSTTRYHFKIPCKNPGFYKIGFGFNLSLYDDTVKRVFGFNPKNITAIQHIPDDFDAFWKASRDSLKKIPPKYKMTLERALSINGQQVYLVEMQSWGNVTVRGWLTIPNERPKKIPVKYRLPGYVVKMEPSFDDKDFAVFNFNVRGNGNSADAIDTHGEYNLYNVENKDEYVYRAVYMDCIRGLDFLCAQAAMGLDTSKILVDGASQGGGLVLALAAMDKRVKLVTCEVPLYTNFRRAYEITALDPQSQTPVGMLVNYVRTHPSFSKEKLFKVWDYYDPVNFVPKIKCPVLMAIGLLDQFCPPECSFATYNVLKNKNKEIWVSPNKTHEVDDLYYTYQYLWYQDYFRMY